MTTALVGLIGKKRTGKDTFAARLVGRHGFARLAFADPLKDAVGRLDPYVTYTYSGPERLSELLARVGGWEAAKDKYPEVRRLLQEYGMSIRDVDMDFWVKALSLRASVISGPIVVTDVRFPNEADWIERSGGVLVRLTRPGTGADEHVSETALDTRETVYTFHNAGTIRSLHEFADTVAAQTLTQVRCVR